MNVLVMKYFGNLFGVSRLDRVWHEEVHMCAGIEWEWASRADQRVLRWFGHIERMDVDRISKRVLMVDVSGGWDVSGGLVGWMA